MRKITPGDVGQSVTLRHTPDISTNINEHFNKYKEPVGESSAMYYFSKRPFAARLKGSSWEAYVATNSMTKGGGAGGGGGAAVNGDPLPVNNSRKSRKSKKSRKSRKVRKSRKTRRT